MSDYCIGRQEPDSGWRVLFFTLCIESVTRVKRGGGIAVQRGLLAQSALSLPPACVRVEALRCRGAYWRERNRRRAGPYYVTIIEINKAGREVRHGGVRAQKICLCLNNLLVFLLSTLGKYREDLNLAKCAKNKTCHYV